MQAMTEEAMSPIAGRPAAADLHVLPSGAGDGRPGRADPAHPRRPRPRPEIARAFLVPEPTLAQRLVRAKRKIRDAGIPYRVPPAELLPERLDGVLRVLYLVFNEGYAAIVGRCADPARAVRRGDPAGTGRRRAAPRRARGDSACWR